MFYGWFGMVFPNPPCEEMDGEIDNLKPVL